MGLTNNLGKLSNMITSTGSAVGIGTSSPQSGYILDVKGFSQFGNSVYPNVIRLGDQDTNSTIIQSVSTGGVAKDLTFWNTSERMRITATGYVGIGTSTPVRPLDIYDASTPVFAMHNSTTTGSNDRGFLIYVSGSDSYIQNKESSGILGFITGGNTERMRITSSGNVGINGTPTSYSTNVYFDVIGNSTNQGGIIQTRNSDNSVIGSFFTNLNGLNIRTETNHPMLFSTAGSERMRITSGGNVGIGTSSPSYNLDVQVGGTATQRLRNNAAGGTATLLLETANTFSGTSQAFVRCIGNAGGGQSQLVFATSGSSGDSSATERMRIFANGNVAVGTSTDTTFKFTAQGEVLSDGDSAALFVQARDLSTRYAWYASNSTYLNFYNTGSGVTGQFTRTSGAYTALSDVNKKKDFEQSEIGLNAILGLKPTLFRMKDDDENSEKQLGFIAQEVKEFIPQAYVKNGDFIGLQDRPIIAALVKSIQELEARIKTLENK